MRVLAGHASKHASATAAEMAEHPPDAYEVLGVEPQMAAGEVKKRYWRLSLLIHPDKCDHSQAHEAFQVRPAVWETAGLESVAHSPQLSLLLVMAGSKPSIAAHQVATCSCFLPCSTGNQLSSCLPSASVALLPIIPTSFPHHCMQAVSVAAKHLQDVGLRKAVDDRREDARLHKLAEEHVAQQERERQWRVARGEATAEDLAGPVAISAKAARETWMTELPPERQANAAAMPSVSGATLAQLRNASVQSALV